jgi:hypothetical protein
MKEGGSGEEERTRFAWQQLTSRQPTGAELNVVVGLYRQQLAEYTADQPAAEKLLATGLAPRDKALPVAELAAWTEVARATLSLHEAITRE